jgi:hypothetical protein
MTPANMDKACWNPNSSASTTGMSSFKPKNGAGLRDFRMKGRFGVKRKA